MATQGDVTELLELARRGEHAAMDRLFAAVYEQLRALARRQLRGERSGHTLSATALVSEAYIKLVGSVGEWADRTHFFAVAARAMRQILVDHARARLAQKRGGGAVRVTLADDAAAEARDEAELIALNDALIALSEQSPRLASIVEFRYFAGLGNAEIGEVLGVSERTVQRDWRIARAFLARELLGEV